MPECPARRLRFRRLWLSAGDAGDKVRLAMAEIGRRKRDDALLLAIAAGNTIRDVARAANIGERTATRRLADPAFRRRVVELQADMVSWALGKIADGMSDAAGTLRKLLKAKGESVRLGACRAMLEVGVKLREVVDTDERLQALERRLAEKERR
jgi:hypothetical protein